MQFHCRDTVDDFYAEMAIPEPKAIEADSWQDEDEGLVPVKFTADGRVPSNVRLAWCLAVATFADGSRHEACAACWGDSEEGPLLPTVFNGKEDVPLMVPPAPDFVLKEEGPEVFAAKFGSTVERVFPVRLEVVPRFASTPQRRHALHAVSGRRDGSGAEMPRARELACPRAREWRDAGMRM